MVTNPNEIRHLPVLPDEVVGLLVTNKGGAYLDLTAGTGGHLRALSHVLQPEARLYGIDADLSAIKQAERGLGGIAQFRGIVHANYASVKAVAADLDDNRFDGILLDLGLSTLQLDSPDRGFSYRFDSPLDMRFDPDSGRPSAADLISTASEQRLVEILREFGEERQAARLARAIVTERRSGMIKSTTQLADIVRKVVRPPHQTKSLARVFQALRIAVNDELAQVDSVLPDAVDLLTDSGRLAVISYHSLEDRRIKRFFQQEARGCICPPTLPACVCGRAPRLSIVTRKPVYPTDEEVNRNSRARSARLRVAERIGS